MFRRWQLQSNSGQTSSCTHKHSEVLTSTHKHSQVLISTHKKLLILLERSEALIFLRRNSGQKWNRPSSKDFPQGSISWAHWRRGTLEKKIRVKKNTQPNVSSDVIYVTTTNTLSADKGHVSTTKGQSWLAQTPHVVLTIVVSGTTWASKGKGLHSRKAWSWFLPKPYRGLDRSPNGRTCASSPRCPVESET